MIFLAVVASTSALFFSVNLVSANEISLTIIASDNRYKFYSSEIGYYNGEYYLKNASEVIDGIFLDTVKRPINSKVVFIDNGEFYLTEERNGKQLLKDKLYKDIKLALNQNKQTVVAKFKTITPSVSKNLLKTKTVLRASFSTSYPYSTSERKHNIKLATKKINGVMLKKGEEFSFNKVVGERTEENGFKTAKIIQDGAFIDGIGGGVCQVSTTLYNTAILSGLKITERHSHSLQVSYVEPSFDAMVNSNTSDLKFVNVTESDIYISAYADDEKLTFKFYGVKQTEEYQRVSIITNTILPESILEVEDETLPYGETVIVEKPKNGVESEGYLIKIVNGVKVKTYKIRSDKYKAVRGKMLIGTHNKI